MVIKTVNTNNSKKNNNININKKQSDYMRKLYNYYQIEKLFSQCNTKTNACLNNHHHHKKTIFITCNIIIMINVI